MIIQVVYMFTLFLMCISSSAIIQVVYMFTLILMCISSSAHTHAEILPWTKPFTSKVCSRMTEQWSDRSAMSSRKTLSLSGPMSYLHWGSGPHPEGEKALLIWTHHIMEHSKDTVKTACNIQIDEKRGSGRPKMTWKQLTERDHRVEALGYQPSWQTHLEILCEICHACSKPATWKWGGGGWGHWCECCPCIYWLIKSPMMMIMIPYYVYHKQLDCKPEQIAETQIKLIIKVLHCSAVITRSSGAMNTDRVIRGPRYTWSALYGTWQPHPLAPLQFPPVIMGYYTLHVCYIVCSFFIYLFFIFFLLLKLCACTLPDFRFILLIQ